MKPKNIYLLTFYAVWKAKFYYKSSVKQCSKYEILVIFQSLRSINCIFFKQSLGCIMKIPTKAALISAISFPGAGHFFLKKYTSGCLLLLIHVVILVFLLKDLIVMLEPLIVQIEAGNLPLAIDSMKDLLLKQSLFANENTSSAIPYAIGLLWLIAIIDAYRLGLISEMNTNKGT